MRIAATSIDAAVEADIDTGLWSYRGEVSMPSPEVNAAAGTPPVPMAASRAWWRVVLADAGQGRRQIRAYARE